MNLRFFRMLSLAMVVCLAPALLAQEEGRRRGGEGRQRGERGEGRGQRGPGGGGFRGGFGFGGGFQVGAALELMSLLRIEEVRKEVEMEDATYKAISDGAVDMRSLFRAEPEERAEKLKEANVKAQDMLDEVLAPEQLRRLMGLLIQQKGLRGSELSAASNTLIAKEIGLDDEGVKKIKEAAEKASSGMRDKMREMFQGGGGGGFDREKMQAVAKEASEEGDKLIGEILTSEQKEKLEALKGEKFEFPERSGRGRGGPGGPGGRGRGGRPGGGGRPSGGDRPTT